MNEEEKQALEKFKNFIYTYQEVIDDEYSGYEEKESAEEYQEVSEKLLKLIEKQQKVIEELKKKNESIVYDYEEVVNKKWICKDKIREKIEELEKPIQEGQCLNVIQGYVREGNLILLRELLGE